MKYFGSVALLCWFQSIRLSVACYGYTVEVVETESGPQNNLKFSNDMYFELTEDCTLMANSTMTLERPYTAAVISVKAKNDYMDLLTLKHLDLCKFISDYSIVGFSCPSVEPGRKRFEIGGKRDISEYGPFLGFLAGNVTILFKAIYDGDTDNPDVSVVVLNVKLKDDTPAWIF